MEKGLIEPERIQHCLASKLGVPFVSLRHFDITQDAIKRINADTAFTHKAVPLYVYGDKLVVALEDPTNWQVTDALRNSARMTIEPMMASRDDIAWALNFHY